MIKTHGLSHISLSVQDPDVSLAFYSAVFGVREYYRDDAVIQALGPGKHDVLVFEQRENRARGGIDHFGFRVTAPEDLTGAIAEVEAAGGKILRHGEHCPGEPYLFVEDPDGHEIEIWYETATA